MKYCYLLLIVTYFSNINAQVKRLRYQDRSFQISLVPGVSSNGINEGWYFNKFSINLLSGVSAGSRHLELAGISNLSLQQTTGIQIAGIANIIGANAFINLTLREERNRIVEEEFKSKLTGIQISGIENFVRDDMVGGQLSGVFNIVYGSSLGIQIAGLGNISNKDLTGLQLAGFYNIAVKSVGGIQIAGFINSTNGALAGIQLGMFNKNTVMVGKKTTPPVKYRSLQIGLINKSKLMAGTQIGLINISREMRGTQIGLINFFKAKPPSEGQRSGIPIGLLNISSTGGFLRLSADELFLLNVDKSTGNCYNCSNTPYRMPFDDRYQKFNQNVLIFSYNPEFAQNARPLWAFGYAFERIKYNKVTMFPMRSGPQNKTHFFSWGAKVQHLNWSKNLEKAFNIRTAVIGRIGKVWKKKYLFVGLSLNHYLSTIKEQALGNQLMMINSSTGIINHNTWPGYLVGIQL
ncbi:MAG: hypothetical protein OEX02_11290 [Cyclobacteriaceae bacterium]|nr:hypothetical protein [Cyclobacteriaceae bacterium]